MTTEVGSDIAHAAALLRQGGLVAIPTETVYGLSGNGTDPDAIRRIFEAKGRPLHNPLILHISGVDDLGKYALDVPESARILASHFWPGPLTMLFKKRPGSVPDILNNGLAEVAIRVPRHPMTLALLRMLDFPLAAPSANPFGYISPTTAEHVQRQLAGRIPYVLDGGPCPTGIESTILRFEGERPMVLRSGAIPIEALQAIIEGTDIQASSSPKIVAPGMLASHYSPHTPFILVDDLPAFLAKVQVGKVGIMAFREHAVGFPTHLQAVLSPTGSLEEAAQNLYAAMHHLDTLGLDMIIAERLPENGIGIAINDRLTRAATEKSA